MLFRSNEFALIKDKTRTFLIDVATNDILLDNLNLTYYDFSKITIDERTHLDHFFVYKDEKEKSFLYNLKTKEVTIKGNYKEIVSNYLLQPQPGENNVLIIDKDDTYKIMNYKTGKQIPNDNYNLVNCSTDKVCVFNEKEIYDYTENDYILKTENIEKIYLATKEKHTSFSLMLPP